MLMDMTSKVQFDIYYSEGTTKYGSNRIIGFKCIKNKSDKLGERNLPSV
jgi:hypothetical protein